MEQWLQVLLGVSAGLGLAAACGFRVFVPFFFVSLAVNADLMQVNEEFAFLGSPVALVGFGAATLFEIGAYFVPWLDNLLDSVSTPAAAVAGAILSSAVLVDVDPWLRWTLVAIAGAAAATAVQVPTVALRGASSATTGGLANPLVSGGEAAVGAGFSVLAIFAPVLALVLLVVAFWLAMRWVRSRREREASLPSPA